MTEESTEQVPAGSLVDAIKRRDESALRAIVEHDPAQAEARDEAGVSVLMLAHYHRVDDNAIRAARSSALDVFEAATLGDVARLRELLDSDPSLVHAWSQDKGTALHFACYFNQPNAALLLLERGSCTGAVSPTFGGVTPLHSAAAAGNNAAVRALLAAGADPNARQKGGFTAIHTAAFTGNNEMVDDLLEADADPALKTEQGHDAADYARAEGNEALAERLRKG